jgi:hypothetical protein
VLKYLSRPFKSTERPSKMREQRSGIPEPRPSRRPPSRSPNLRNPKRTHRPYSHRRCLARRLPPNHSPRADGPACRREIDQRLSFCDPVNLWRPNLRPQFTSSSRCFIFEGHRAHAESTAAGALAFAGGCRLRRSRRLNAAARGPDPASADKPRPRAARRPSSGTARCRSSLESRPRGPSRRA